MKSLGWALIVLLHHPILNLNLFVDCHDHDEDDPHPSMSDYHRRKMVIQDIMNSSVALIPPSFFTGKTTQIDLQICFLSVDRIDQMAMEYSVMMHLQMTWTDSRLQYEPFDTDQFQPLELGPQLIEKIWVPDLYFINTKSAFLHDVTIPNKYMHIHPNGEIFFRQRLSMTLVCEMNLRKFPFDSQVCHISTESCSFSTALINITWAKNPIVFRKGLKLPQFKIDKTEHVGCTKNYIGIIEQYACLRAELYLTRLYDFYITQVYMPSAIVVVLSWVSFWLDAEATPARITLGLLTVLTMTNQNTESKVHLPRVSYIKAIDVWMGTCLLFVFAALVEFAYVNVHARTEEFILLSKEIKQSLSVMIATHEDNEVDENWPQPTQSTSGILKNVESYELVTKDTAGDGSGVDEKPKKKLRILSIDGTEENSQERLSWKDSLIARKLSSVYRMASTVSTDSTDTASARRLDKTARVTFPAAFIVFNIAYWSFYMTWEQELTLGAAT